MKNCIRDTKSSWNFARLLSQFGIQKKVEMNASGAEVVNFSKYENHFDLVFTSLPILI